MHSIAAPRAIATTTPRCDRVRGASRREASLKENRVFPLLTDPQVYDPKLTGHRYFVQLVSKSWELQDDRAVPSSDKVIDVVVVEPTESAIRQLIASAGWLVGWEMVDFWQEAATDSYVPF